MVWSDLVFHLKAKNESNIGKSESRINFVFILFISQKQESQHCII
jgi:hypothetical protein